MFETPDCGSVFVTFRMNMNTTLSENFLKNFNDGESANSMLKNSRPEKSVQYSVSKASASTDGGSSGNNQGSSSNFSVTWIIVIGVAVIAMALGVLYYCIHRARISRKKDELNGKSNLEGIQLEAESATEGKSTANKVKPAESVVGGDTIAAPSQPEVQA